MTSFAKFMEECRVKTKNGPYNHVAYGYTGFEGKFLIAEEDREHFHDLAAQAAYGTPRTPFFIVERSESVGPIRIDLDFKYTVDATKLVDGVPPRFYAPSFIQAFVEKLGKTVHETLAILPEELAKNLAFVFEKTGASASTKTEDGTVTAWKDGLHVMMPKVITEPYVQRLIRAEMLELLDGLMEQHKTEGVELVNTTEDVYDESVLERNGWPLWGSVKPKGHPYHLASIWNASQTSVHRFTSSDVNANENVEINRELGMLESAHMYSKNKQFPTAEFLVDYLSIQGYDKEKTQEFTSNGKLHAKKLQDEENEKAIQKKRRAHGTQFVISSTDDMQKVLKFVDLLSPSRADSYTEWFELGCCLHNLHNVDDRLYDRWVEFSQMSDKYSNDESDTACMKKWSSMKDTGFSMGTLCMWARNDSPDDYKKLVFNNIGPTFLECCKKTVPEPVATEDKKTGSTKVGTPKPKQWASIVYYVTKVIYEMYDQEYVCSSWQQKKWYRFSKHRWHEEEMGILGKLSEDVAEAFYTKAVWFSEQQKLKTDTTWRDEQGRYRQACAHIAEALRNPLNKDMLAREACERFYWQDDRRHEVLRTKPFEEILDCNQFLIGMDNGVYDMTTHTHRPGRCEDYVSKSTNNKYHDFTWTDPEVVMVMQFVKQVLPHVDEREYVLALLASFCDGQIQEKFHIFVGSGGNGKSKLIELFQKAMGDKYCGQLPVTALTGKQTASSAPTPEFARLKGMRFVVMQEPDQKEKLHAGKLKELTGGDVLHARALHKEPIEFKPQFGLVMASNVLPEVPGDDGGVWRRMRVVRFNSKFVEEAKANPAEHMYPIDEQLVKKLDEWRFAFFWVLMQYYKVFALGDEDKTILQYDDEMNQTFPTNGPKPGLRKSMSIASETQKYKQRNNYIGDFIDTVVSKNHPESVVITLHELWMRYSAQCRADGRMPNKDELRDAMELRFNEMQTVQDKHKGWKGVRLEVEGGAVGA